MSLFSNYWYQHHLFSYPLFSSGTLELSWGAKQLRMHVLTLTPVILKYSRLLSDLELQTMTLCLEGTKMYSNVQSDFQNKALDRYSRLHLGAETTWYASGRQPSYITYVTYLIWFTQPNLKTNQCWLIVTHRKWTLVFRGKVLVVTTLTKASVAKTNNVLPKRLH